MHVEVFCVCVYITLHKLVEDQIEGVKLQYDYLYSCSIFSQIIHFLRASSACVYNTK